MILKKATESDFDRIYAEMEQSFISDEIRRKEDAFNILSNKEYVIYIFEENGRDVGFITIWELEGFAFAEHFVIYENYRNRGYGSKGMLLIEQIYDNIILEAEHPETPLQARRIGFYERLGFKQNDYPYLQPAYKKDGNPVPLILMSYPNKISVISAAVQEIYRNVYDKNLI